MRHENIKPRSIVSGVIWSALDSAVGQALTLAIYMIMARLLSPQILGIVATGALALEFCRAVLIESIAIAVQARAEISQPLGLAFAMLPEHKLRDLPQLIKEPLVLRAVWLIGLAHTVQRGQFCQCTCDLIRRKRDLPANLDGRGTVIDAKDG